MPRHNYRLGVPRGGDWRELLNSDAPLYGGSGQGNLGGVDATPVAWHGHAQSVVVTLAAAGDHCLEGRPRGQPPRVRRVHRMPFGAETLSSGGTRFRLWAPAVPAVTLCLDGGPAHTMIPIGGGWFEVTAAEARPGSRYRFRLPDGVLVPDPASRHQPEDVHGPSEVVDPEAFDWTDAGWRGRPFEEAVFYELHVGAFAPAGTFDGVATQLDRLARLGVTAIELMPLAEMPGRRGWGYDGVYPFAPEASYGTPAALKRLVCAAHARDLMVFVDVVYNHFGPEGNYLARYAPQFFTPRHRTPWGDAIDFEGPDARVVRDFVVHNALYWLEEFHADGLRLDAVHAIHDASEPDIVVELAETVHRTLRPDRQVHLVLENDRNQAHFLARAPDGRARWYAAQWNDDAHHAFHVLLTGERNGYYADYADEPAARLGRALAEGFVHQGEPSPFRGGAARGEPSAHLPPTAFVTFLQNHDQVGNRALGDRLTTPGTAAGAAGGDGRAPPGSITAAALHGRGVGCHQAVPVLLRPRTRAGAARARGTPPRVRARSGVSQRPGAPAGPHRRGHLRRGRAPTRRRADAPGPTMDAFRARAARG